MSWRHARYRRDSADLQMTPMIDVVFLLLIFFVCTASFQAIEYVLPANLLLSGASSVDVPLEPPEDLEEVVVHVSLANQQVAWKVNDRPCSTLAAVGELLSAYAQIDNSLPARRSRFTT